jgi:multiple sugar transport system permease protein
VFNKHKVYRGLNSLVYYFLLLLLVSFTFFPILVIISSSFAKSVDVWSYPPRLFKSFSVASFIQLIKQTPRFLPSLKNSIIITAGTLLLTMVCSFASAFALSRFKSRGLRVSVFYLVAIRMFPPIVVTIPLYPIFRSLGLVDTHLALVLVNSVFSFSLATMMMKTFVDDIPVELEEAAMIEGCSRPGAFLRITLPLTAPGICAVAIFIAIGVWNDYTFALIFAPGRAITTPIILQNMSITELGVDWGVLFSGSFIQLLPMLIMVIVIHKYLIRGVQSGAIK